MKRRWYQGRKKPIEPAELQKALLPRHVAIITDGNGRWAGKRGLPRTAGHAVGVQRVREVIRATNHLAIPYLTLYAFSTENWRRPEGEVHYLLDLPSRFLRQDLPELLANNVQVRMLGDREAMPAHTQAAMDECEAATRECTGLTLSFAVNYGARAELTEAIRALAEQVAAGELQPEAITDKSLEQHLLTRGLPDPDLMIRTSGEMRLSNFLLWQLAYSELLFVDTLWPDFTAQHFYNALRSFQLRSRRYGAVH